MAASDIALRDRLIAECRACDATVHQIVQVAVELLMFTIIAGSANVDAAECEINNICHYMQGNMRQTYTELHAMADAPQSPLQ